MVEELRSIKLKEATKKVEEGVEETLTYCDFSSEHWTRIRTNNVIEQLNWEIRRHTRVVDSFPDGNFVRMLVCTRLHHVASTQWGSKRYMNMKHLETALEDISTAGQLHSYQSLQTMLSLFFNFTKRIVPYRFKSIIILSVFLTIIRQTKLSTIIYNLLHLIISEAVVQIEPLHTL